MNFNFRNLQRYLRAKLSVLFNKPENENYEIKKIIDEVYKISNDYLIFKKKIEIKPIRYLVNKFFN